MFTVTKTDLPQDALLNTYATRSDCFTDCFYVDVQGNVSQEKYIMAFYRTWLFNLEKWVLDKTLKRPSDDATLTQMAKGSGHAFAAWNVEARGERQVLLADIEGGRTRSWLMAKPMGDKTRLFFGSAVLPAKEGAGLGPVFTALLGFHNVYSYALLGACARDLRRDFG